MCINSLFDCICWPFKTCFQLTKSCCSCCCPDNGDDQTPVTLAIIFPPLGVLYKCGIGMQFWICLLVTIIGYLPGMLYAIFVLPSHRSGHDIHVFIWLTTIGYVPGLFYAIYVIRAS